MNTQAKGENVIFLLRSRKKTVILVDKRAGPGNRPIPPEESGNIKRPDSFSCPRGPGIAGADREHQF